MKKWKVESMSFAVFIQSKTWSDLCALFLQDLQSNTMDRKVSHKMNNFK